VAAGVRPGVELAGHSGLDQGIGIGHEGPDRCRRLDQGRRDLVLLVQQLEVGADVTGGNPVEISDHLVLQVVGELVHRLRHLADFVFLLHVQTRDQAAFRQLLDHQEATTQRLADRVGDQESDRQRKDHTHCQDDDHRQA